MKNIFVFIRRNLALIGALVVFLSSIAFALTTMAVLGVGIKFDLTNVGYIYLGGTDESDYESVLNDKIGSWKISSDYSIEYQGYTYDINLALFQFDMDKTISSIVKNQTNKAYFELSTTNHSSLMNQLSLAFSEPIMSQVNTVELLADIQNDMENLSTFKKYSLINYLPESAKITLGDIVQITNIANENFIKFSQHQIQITIDPKSRFSLLETFKDSDFNNEELSIIASGMQKLLRNTPITNFIFSQNPSMPSWGKLGMNVRILKVNQYDFSFYNPLNYALTIDIRDREPNTLEFELKGFPWISEYETIVTTLNEIPFQDTYIFDASINELTPSVEIMEETADEITYRVKVSEGVNGLIKAFTRTETKLSGSDTIRLYEEEISPVNAVYHYNVVSKGCD